MIHVLSDFLRSRGTMRLLAALTLIGAFLAGAAVQTVLAHDTRLDSVLAAVEKAQALVQVALAEDVPVLPDKIGHRVGRHLSRALHDLEDAYNEVLAAITLEDSVP